MTVTTRTVCSLLGLMLAAPAAGQPAGDRPQPLSAQVRAAWEKAGAIVGWMGRDGFALTIRPGTGEGKAGEMPAFTFPDGQGDMVATLPVPERAFGVNLSYTKLRPELLKELA